MSIPATVELTVTEWPHRGGPRVIAGPTSWPVDLPEDDVSRLNAVISARMEQGWAEVQLWLYGLYPADPGWLAASAELRSPNGSVVGRMRPVRFYGRPNEIGSHIYFPSEHDTAAYSCQLRILSGGL